MYFPFELMEVVISWMYWSFMLLNASYGLTGSLYPFSSFDVKENVHSDISWMLLWLNSSYWKLTNEMTKAWSSRIVKRLFAVMSENWEVSNEVTSFKSFLFYLYLEVPKLFLIGVVLK